MPIKKFFFYKIYKAMEGRNVHLVTGKCSLEGRNAQLLMGKCLLNTSIELLYSKGLPFLCNACYPVDADEAFVGAVHLIHYPQAWLSQEVNPLKGSRKKPAVSVNSIWTRSDSRFHPLVFGVVPTVRTLILFSSSLTISSNIRIY